MCLFVPERDEFCVYDHGRPGWYKTGESTAGLRAFKAARFFYDGSMLGLSADKCRRATRILRNKLQVIPSRKKSSQIFLRALAKEGFEIGLHTVSSGHDLREVTFKGYERFKEIFGAYPEVNIMHSKNRENIYWGKNVFKSGLMRWLVGLYSDVQFSGEDPSSPFFWGDVCYDKTKFVRLWGTSDINTIKFNPGMPYHDSAKPYVKYWFSFSDGYTKPYFVKLVSKKHVDRLTEERGASIVYTHFAAGFTRKTDDGSYVIDPEVESCLRYLSEKKDGWFVPAGSLLERLLAFKNVVLLETRSSVTVANVNSFKIPGVTLLGTAGETLYDHVGKAYTANEEGEIIIGDLKSELGGRAFYRDGMNSASSLRRRKSECLSI